MTKRLTKADYTNACKTLASAFEDCPDTIKPVTIIQNGKVGTPGVSDIDLIFVFPADFTAGDEFKTYYENVINNIPHKEIFFIHSPIVIDEHNVKDLPLYTMNPARNMKIIFGKKPDFSAQDTSRMQSALISMEFIQFRLIQLMSMLVNNHYDLNSILLRGHTLAHSISLAKRAKIQVDDKMFKGLGYVEEFRDQMAKGQAVQISDADTKKLFMRVVKEFYILYLQFCNLMEEHIHFYAPEDGHYEYTQNVFLAGVLTRSEEFKAHTAEGKTVYQGLHWTNMALRDLYFGLDQKNSKILVTEELRAECEKRRDFMKNVWAWNVKAFGNMNAGLSHKPCVDGTVTETLAAQHLDLKTYADAA